VSREPIVVARYRRHVARGVIAEPGAIPLPIRVKEQLPCPGGGEAELVIITRVTIEVGDYHDIISGAAVEPAAEDDHFVGVINPNELDILAG
jgi:hypothetical protein